MPDPEAAFWPDFNGTDSILVCTACTPQRWSTTTRPLMAHHNR